MAHPETNKLVSWAERVYEELLILGAVSDPRPWRALTDKEQARFVSSLVAFAIQKGP